MTRCSFCLPHCLFFTLSTRAVVKAWVVIPTAATTTATTVAALSNAYLENDLVAIRVPPSGNNNNEEDDSDATAAAPRLCAVRHDGSVAPLCVRQDDVETDLWVDPREYANPFFWSSADSHINKGPVLTDDCVTATYGEAFYGQRPVPSLGGGPGYGAAADDCWSVDEAVLEQVQADGVHLPVVDMGMAHGEKARAGAF